jgi:hypothetical protein
LLVEYLELPGTLWLGIYFSLFVCQWFQMVFRTVCAAS